MIEDKRIAVIGQGYVGLPLAIAAAEAGLVVRGIDIDERKIDAINKCNSPVEDIINSRIKDVIEGGQYLATTDFSIVADSEIVIICVPTPLDSNLEPDLNALNGAIKSIAKYLKPETLIISESTSFPGTLRNVIMPALRDKFSGDFSKLYFASAPERVNPGDFKWDIKNTPRLVGGIDEKSTKIARDFYATFCSNVVLTATPEIAEAAKILENTFRLVNIALLNELNKVFSTNGIDTNAVVDAASTKPYGYMAFRSGVGIGGHCIPVDPMYLTWWARQNGCESKLVELADSVSRSMPKFVAEKAISISSARVKRVLILGVAYKPGVADTRETPVRDLIKHLQDLGKEVAWHDPLVSEWNGSESVNTDWPCDVAILATNQPGIDISVLQKNEVLILDCTNTYRGFEGVISL